MPLVWGEVTNEAARQTKRQNSKASAPWDTEGRQYTKNFQRT